MWIGRPTCEVGMCCHMVMTDIEQKIVHSERALHYVYTPFAIKLIEMFVPVSVSESLSFMDGRASLSSPPLNYATFYALLILHCSFSKSLCNPFILLLSLLG